MVLPASDGDSPSITVNKTTAKRSRSFKEDFLEKLNNMKSPAARNQSPTKLQYPNDPARPSTTLGELRNIQDTFRRNIDYVRTIVDKGVYEVLPGGSSVLLETLLALQATVQKVLPNEHSHTLESRITHVNQSLAEVIKWADVVMVADQSIVDQRFARQLCDDLDRAIENLISFVEERKAVKEAQYYKQRLEKNKTSRKHSDPVGRRSSKSEKLSVNGENRPRSKSNQGVAMAYTAKAPTSAEDRMKSYFLDNLITDRYKRHSDTPTNLERIAYTERKQSNRPGYLEGLDSMYKAKRRNSVDSAPDSHNSSLDSNQENRCPTQSNKSSPSSGRSSISSTDVPPLPPKRRHAQQREPAVTSPTSHWSAKDQFMDWPVSRGNMSQDWPVRSSDSTSPSSVSGSSLDSINNKQYRILDEHNGSVDEVDCAVPRVTWTEVAERRCQPHDLDVLEAKLREISTSPLSPRVESGFVSAQTSFSSNGSYSDRMFRQPPPVPEKQRRLRVEEEKPPLPPKKKHIMAYMKMVENGYSQPNTDELLRNAAVIVAQRLQQLELQNNSQSYRIEIGHDDRSSTFTRHESPPPALPPKKNKARKDSKDLDTWQLTRQGTDTSSESAQSPDDITLDDILLSLDVSEHLVFKKDNEDGPEVRGGKRDALIVHATRDPKHDFAYQEAFVTTYRTFVSPVELIHKLLHRYTTLRLHPDTTKQRAAKTAYSLLVRVVDDLALADLEQPLLTTVSEFVSTLLRNGELNHAKALRRTLIDKVEAKKNQNNQLIILPNTQPVSGRSCSFCDFKSSHLAEQMTLLDAELFQQIELPELLSYAREQNEEQSPNLTKFTEHFNKMSYWVRTRILEQKETKEREKFVLKFLKLMKHLRRLNNFNSYLALLSALDSAPIRRLDWQKHIAEGLQEYCQLMDTSGSFRVYRQALSEATAPCIPYIGLILQDLSFVHVGNSDILPDGNINFTKRWMQFNILHNMKKFHKCPYNFKKDEKVLSFFNSFENHLQEEELWQISEKLKPRNWKKKGE